MLLSFDLAVDAVAEHDRWHTQEHLPERLSIPGFRRGTRWIAAGGGPRYMILYEVADLAVLTSAAYLARLNNPTPWTARVMSHYRGMSRGLCAVQGSFGFGQGEAAALIRFSPEEARAAALRQWLLEQVLPEVSTMPGMGSAHLLQAARQATMTNEQRIRGADRPVDSALILTGYDAAAVAGCATSLCEAEGLQAHGATGIGCFMYRWNYSLACSEVGAQSFVQPGSNA